MRDSDLLVVIPTLALLALAFVKPGPQTPRVGVAAIVCVAIFSAFLELRAILPDSMLWPTSEVARRVNWLHDHLRKSKDWDLHPVIIMAGSSATNYGVDTDLLERLLRERGLPATVLSFCMPGANHLERLYMIESFLTGLTAQEQNQFAQANVIFLGEIFDAYDRNPLYRIEKEASTERAVMFLNPKNAWESWSAYRVLLNENSNLPDWSMAWLLGEHALMNRFAVGSYSSMRIPKSKKRKTAPFFPLEGAKSTFRYEEAVATLEKFEGIAPKQNGLSPTHPQWDAVFSYTRERLASVVDHYGFYALPTLEPSRAKYVRAFRQSKPDGTFVLRSATPQEIKSLLNSGFWFDGVHPTGIGAEKFTSLLAVELDEVLRKEVSP